MAVLSSNSSFPSPSTVNSFWKGSDIMIGISKPVGALLSLGIMYKLYFAQYQDFVSGNPHASQLLLLFGIGALLQYYDPIAAGTRAEVTLWGKATGTFWEDGPALVPSILRPLEELLNIHPLFGLKKPFDEEAHLNKIAGNHYHFRDQTLPNFNLNATGTIQQVERHRFLTNFIRWVFCLNYKTADTRRRGLGWRMMVVAYVIGWNTNPSLAYEPMQKNFSATVSVPSPVHMAKQEEHIAAPLPPVTGEKMSVLVNLDKLEQRPIFPSESYFKDIEEAPFPPELFGEWKYFKYYKKNGMRSALKIEGPSCIPIPAGEIMGFETLYRPRYAANMRDKVNYTVKTEFASKKQKMIAEVAKLRDSSDDPYFFGEYWEILYENWYKVDTRRTIEVQALPLSEIPGKALGGLVCF